MITSAGLTIKKFKHMFKVPREGVVPLEGQRGHHWNGRGDTIHRAEGAPLEGPKGAPLEKPLEKLKEHQ